jgi:hypothetical protein
VQKLLVLLMTLGVCLVLTACGSGSASSAPPVNRHRVSDAAVCRAFNAVSSPLEKPNSVEISFAKLAATARDANIRQEGKVLLRYHEPAAALDSKSFFEIANTCVAQGFTPKDWAELT